MAQKRMFSLKIIDTDNFLNMPVSARLLYYDLSMRADDDGFIDSRARYFKYQIKIDNKTEWLNLQIPSEIIEAKMIYLNSIIKLVFL